MIIIILVIIIIILVIIIIILVIRLREGRDPALVRATLVQTDTWRQLPSS